MFRNITIGGDIKHFILISIFALFVSGCADAGKDQSVVSGTTVTLDASASKADFGGEIKSYSWRQVKGKNVQLSDKKSIHPTFIAPNVKAETELLFRLTTVEEGGHNSPWKTQNSVRITVKPSASGNTPPIAKAEVNASNIKYGESVTFDANASLDRDGEIVAYKWKDENGVVLSEERQFRYLFTTTGSHTVTLTVRDNDDATDTDSVTVSVESSLVSLSLDATALTLDINETSTLTVRANYDDNTSKEITTPIVWLIGDEDVLTVDTNNTLKAHKRGITTIQAKVGAIVSNTLHVEVKGGASILQAISVSPNPVNLRVGKNIQTNIIGHYSDGSTQNLDNVNYAILNNTIATVDDAGLIEGLQEGNTTLNIEVGAYNSSVSVVVAKELNTSNFNFTNFGNAYIDKIPTDATVDNYDEKRFCMISGQIKAKDGSPLGGVQVSIHAHPEYGTTLTDANGSYAIPAEGGLKLTMRYAKQGYTTIDRSIQAPVQDWVRSPDVTMLILDTKVTSINLGNSTPKIHISTPISDAKGERSTTLVFDGVTKATVTSADGRTRELTNLSVRATEFETPKSMPSDLPTESAYTYCSDLTVDGVGDDEEVSFDAPVIMYVDNFLGFDVGEIVPVGYYDRKDGVWKASDNGVVVKLLDTDGDGKVDALDSTGDDAPNDLNGDGSTSDEVSGIADNSNYTAGKTYWRAAITHFTPWDHNWPYGPPEDSEDPDTPDTDDDDTPPNDCQADISSYVTKKSRVFHEDIPVAGTDITLHYSSKRVDGYDYVINVSVDMANAPASVTEATVTLDIAGRTFIKNATLGELNKLSFVWDGKDALGKYVAGEVKGIITVVYRYNMVYYRASSDFARAWARTSNVSTGIIGRDKINFVKTKEIKVNIESTKNNNSNIANGWTFSNIHYAGYNAIYKGDGSVLRTKTLFTKNKIKRKLVNNHPNYNTVDHWIFRHDGGELEIDTLTEYSGDNRRIDIDNDGKSSPVDLMIHIFKKDTNGNWQHVVGNDDSDQTFGDGSVHMYDSYIKQNFEAGEYLLAVSNYNLSVSDALSGQQHDMGYRNGGPYEITFNRPLTFLSLPTGSIIEKAGNASFSEGSIKYLFDDFKHITTELLYNHTILEEYNYGSDGYLNAITDRFSQTTTITRDANGKPTQITAPNGQVTTLSVDEHGDLVEVGYEDNSKYTFSYFDGSLMDTMTDPNGNVIKHKYNDIGRIVEEIDGLGGSYQFLRNVSQGETFYSTIQPEGETSSSKDIRLANGDIASTMTLATGENITATFAKDESNSSVLRDGVSSVRTYTTDTLTHQRILASQEVTQPSGLKSTTSYSTVYDGNETHTNSKTQTITQNGKTATRVTDYNNGTETLTTPESRVATRTYDVNTLLTIEEKTGTLTPTTYTYDSKGRVTKETTGTRETSYTYDNRGNVASITDPRGQTTTYSYDIVDNLTQVNYPNGTTEHFSYDKNGNLLTRTVPTPVEHHFSYNGGDLRTNYTSPENKATTYSYDRSKNLTSIVKASGKTITNTYSNGRLESTQTPEGTTNYSYLFADKVGSITTSTASATDESFTYTYDGTLLTKTVQAGVLNHTTEFSYNNDFQVTSSTYAGATESYTYDNDGLLTSSGDYTLTRDPQNAYVTNLTDGTLTQTRSYNSFGEVTEVSDNTFSYELSNRDQSGAIIQKRETLNGTTVTYDYTYDEMGRLTQVKKDNQEVETYTYDNNGNRASATVNGTSITASYTLDDNLKVYGDNTYLYDEDGYLKTKTTPQGATNYSYGTRGELLAVTTPTKSISYKHNALNQRVAKLINGQVVEKYLWKDLTTLLAIYDKDDNLKQRFEYADQRMPISMTQNGQKYYLHYDQVGSLRAVSDTSHSIVKEITYDTYGNMLTDSNPSFTVPFGFAGGLYDADTKLTRFGYRDYDAYTGKWTAKDPIGFSGGDSNLYGYVLGDPVNGFDPLGLLWGDEAGEDALNYWINKQLSTGNSFYYVPAFFAALWTPDTSTSTALTLFPIAKLAQLAKPVQELCAVTRWANPASTTLKSDDWVMLGGKNLKNWALSGKMTPLNPKYHVPYNLGKTFTVPTKSLRYPKGWEKFKGLPPWNQRQIR